MEHHLEALSIVKTLNKAGFVAYYAGGWVRDFLLQHPSDDIDIATNAPPETIQSLFPKTVPIGIAFGIVLVLIENKQYEVATFRKDLEYKDGRRPSRIEFTEAVEDAKRRDFTINGMFYDPIKKEVLDFVGGKKDLELKIIRAIGDPHERIREDRLRMVRAVRLAVRFNFQIEKKTESAIRSHASELFPAVAIERIWQEFTKLATFSNLHKGLLQLHNYHLLQTIFPDIKEVSLEELDQRLQPLEKFPNDAPIIASILEIFPDYSLEERIDLCKYLKLSNEDTQFCIFLYQTLKILRKPSVEKIEWAYFYANPLSSVSLNIFAAHLSNAEAKIFHEEHALRKKQLKIAIDRILQRKPVVTSLHLKELGIAPGKEMGILLREAEKISIDKGTQSAEEVLEILRQIKKLT